MFSVPPFQKVSELPMKRALSGFGQAALHDPRHSSNGSGAEGHAATQLTSENVSRV